MYFARLYTLFIGAEKVLVFLKYVFAGIAGLCLGFLLGAGVAHACDVWNYDHTTGYYHDHEWWSLGDTIYEMLGGAAGAIIGLITGLLGMRHWYRVHRGR